MSPRPHCPHGERSQREARLTANPTGQAFLLTQITFSILPVLLFVSFVVSTVLFALGVALLFVLFWVGVGLLVLAVVLLITSILGLVAWAWGVAAFLAYRWVHALVSPSTATTNINGDDQTRRIDEKKQAELGARATETNGQTETPSKLVR